MWDSMIDYGRLEWQCIMQDLDKFLNIVYEGVFREFDKVWDVNGLIVTHSNLVVTWKVMPLVGIIS